MADFIQACANGFHNILENEGLDPGQILNAKRVAFNVCTAALIGVVALGILGALSLKAVVILGAISLFGRVVAGQSLHRVSVDGIIHQGLRFLAPSRNDISFAGHVIFYNLL
jgi:hypothetical protein